MARQRKKVLKRLMACLLAVTMVITSGIVVPQEANAEAVSQTNPPTLSRTSYRYLLEGESYDFNIINKIKNSTYKWESSDTKVATVNKVGLVTAKKAGTAKINCSITAGNKTYQLSAEVYVKSKVSIPAKGVTIVNKVRTILLGEVYNLNKVFEPKYAKDYINWTSSNNEVATVDKNGFVHGLKLGTVKITATTLSGVSDSLYIEISSASTVSDQNALEKALKSSVVDSIKLESNEDMEFIIPEGDYSHISLFVDIPKGTVKNHGRFKEINIKAIKGDSWHEYSRGNDIYVDTASARIVIEESAQALVHITRNGSEVQFDIKGDVDIFVEASGNIIITGASGNIPNINLLQETTIKTNLALNINASQKATLILNTSEANKTRVNAEADEYAPRVQGSGSITLVVDGKTRVVTDTAQASATPVTISGPTDDRIPPQIYANYGSPKVDGVIDDVWSSAKLYIPKVYGKTSGVSAKHYLMWDDNALYILSLIKDDTLDKTSANAYEQDSLELFLDELYDKGTAYKADDVHYRVNYDNYRTHDAGAKERFYSETKLNSDGYIVESCITWDRIIPANGKDVGFDLQINEAKGGKRDTTITIFDTTGNAYQNPSLFGRLTLYGKTASSAKTGANPYKLLSYIDSVKAIYLDAYVNKDSIEAPLAEAESIAAAKTSTQQEIDDAYDALQAAVDGLDDGSGFIKPSALPEVTALPDLFTFLDGTKVNTLEQWNLRKQEISEMYQYYMYGQPRSGETITFENVEPRLVRSFDWGTWSWVEKLVPAPNQKEIKINLEKDGKTASFNATFTFPSTTTEGVTTITPPKHAGGYPVLIVIGSLGAGEKTYLNSNGYAVAEFNTASVASDNYNRTGAFYNLYPYGKTYDEQTGVLMAWGWGVSKIIDVLEQDSAGANILKISPVNTIVTGVSRNGKAAAVAGAFDSRIKVTAPGSSGAGGMALFRYNSAGKVHNYSSLEKHEFIEFSGNANAWNNYQTNPWHTVGSNESLSNIQSGSEGHWFNDTFQGFSSPNQLPFDQHFLAALAAGSDRYFYITAEVDGSDWINSQGMYAAYLAAQNVYDSLNISDNIGIHLHSTGHAFTLEDTRYLVEFCNKNFYGIIDGIKDLSQLKTSLYELPDNYDPYFDELKAMDGPVLVKAPGQINAVFGSPFVDGEVDEIWSKAFVYIPKISGKATPVTAKHRVMWDDNALYILSEIKDSNLDKGSSNAYEQDSLELFLDELYNRGTAYGSDDVHYRVNYENMRTTDSGEKSRFYSQTKLTADGYLVEACIAWDAITPANNTQLGFDLQINEAKNSARDTTVTIFDTTGNAYQNPSLFGKLVLKGKPAEAVTGTNPYPLLSYIDSVKEIYLDAYVNKDIIDAPLVAAETIAANPASTQAEIDGAYLALQAAVNALNDGSGFTKPSALPQVAELPNVFTFNDGSAVTTMSEWELRKEEIAELYQYYMYGEARSGETITTELINSYKETITWGSWSWETTYTAKPDQKFIKLHIEKDGKTSSFIATATFPSETIGDVVSIKAPAHPDGYPVLIVIGSLGAKQKTYLNNNGYAVVEFNTGSVASDNYNRTGAFYDIYPYGQKYTEQTGVLMAWSWGVSKIIDAIELDAAGAKLLNISPVNTIVTGVSRNGKAAAVAGAFDSRIKITAPGSSGAGGLAMFRYNSAGHIDNYSSLELEEFIDFSGEESGTATWNNFQTNPLHTVGTNEGLSNLQSGGEGHWFNDKFLEFQSHNQLPFDQYYLAALASGPDRYYYITAEVNGSDWVNSKGMYASYLAAQRMYDSLGISDNIGIHLHATGHDFTLEDTKYLVELSNKAFYGQVDGNKDLNHLKTSLYELPDNYDPYFDTLKNLPFPSLSVPLLYNETFNGGIPGFITTVSGAAISLADVNGNKVLEVNQIANGGEVIIAIVNEPFGVPVTVSGSAITVSGAAIAVPVPGTDITIKLSIMYLDEPTGPVGFETGFRFGDVAMPLSYATEGTPGSSKGNWIFAITPPFQYTDNYYLYIKVNNVSKYYIDNIRIY